jgi:hypothetical protein
MTTLCGSYPSLDAARRAAVALRSAGVPARDIGVLGRYRYHDLRAERVGGFSGPVPPDAPFGKFAGPARRRWQAAGGFTDAPDRNRQGSYADVGAGVSISYDRTGEHWHVAGESGLRRVLADADVPADVASRMVSAMGRGRAVMVAEVSELDYDRAAAVARAELRDTSAGC